KEEFSSYYYWLAGSGKWEGEWEGYMAGLAGVFCFQVFFLCFQPRFFLFVFFLRCGAKGFIGHIITWTGALSRFVFSFLIFCCSLRLFAFLFFLPLYFAVCFALSSHIALFL